jgi:hypothetical protein
MLAQLLDVDPSDLRQRLMTISIRSIGAEAQATNKIVTPQAAIHMAAITTNSILETH